MAKVASIFDTQRCARKKIDYVLLIGEEILYR